MRPITLSAVSKLSKDCIDIVLVSVIVLGVPKKYCPLINNRIEPFGLILKLSFVWNKVLASLDFETKINEIQ